MALSVNRAALRRYIERSIQDLPALPVAVTKVLEMTESATATASDLDRLISADPGLSTKVLRVVNSAYYGMSTQISTTSHAIVILGFQQIRNLVLSMAAMSLVKAKTHAMLQTQYAFWRHAFGSACAARMLAERKGASTETRDVAYTGALLHDLGELFLLANFPDLLREVLRECSASGKTIQDAEQMVLGIDHAEIGAMLMQVWNFPVELIEIVAHHHGPFIERPVDTVALVHAADYYASVCGYASVPNGSFNLDPSVAEWLNIHDDELPDFFQSVSDKVRDAETFFDLL
jgi:putative nucleotidyltransferase with HDIG domain